MDIPYLVAHQLAVAMMRFAVLNFTLPDGSHAAKFKGLGCLKNNKKPIALLNICFCRSGSLS
jgi:hypothetical protein